MLLTLLQRDRAEDLQAARLLDRERGQLRLLPVRAVVRRGLQVHCVPSARWANALNNQCRGSPQCTHPHSGGIRFPTVRNRTACVADALYRVMLPVSSRYDV
jgi:hypothetical protein